MPPASSFDRWGAAGPLNLEQFPPADHSGDPTRHPSGCPSREPNPGGSIRTTIRATHPGAAQLRGPNPGHVERFNPATLAGPPILGAQTVGHPGDLPGCPTPSGSTRPLLPGGPCGTVQPGPPNPERFNPGHPTLNGSTRPPMPGHPTGHPFRAPKPKRFNPGHPTRRPIPAAHRRPNASARLKNPPPSSRSDLYIV